MDGGQVSRHHAEISKNRRKWRRIRARVLSEENFRCRTCRKYGNEVDHVTPLARGGACWDRENLQVQCRSCHIDKTAKENRRKLSPDQEDWKEFLRTVH